jgi:hypothetical protein
LPWGNAIFAPTAKNHGQIYLSKAKIGRSIKKNGLI